MERRGEEKNDGNRSSEDEKGTVSRKGSRAVVLHTRQSYTDSLHYVIFPTCSEGDETENRNI